MINDSDNSTINKHGKSIGRATGVGNYSREDICQLINLVETIRPGGKNGWAKLTKRYNLLVHVSRIFL